MKTVGSNAGRGRSRWLGELFVLTTGVAIACSADPDTNGPVGYGSGARSGVGGSVAIGGGTAGKGGGGKGGTGVGFDDGPVVTAERTPPPISGGTLLSLKGGGRVAVSDSDRDWVGLVDLDTGNIDAAFPLEHGAEPGRLIEDDEGRVHVALRGSGDLLSIDTHTGEAVDRRPVCAAPRGVAYDAEHDSVLVACLEGTLVELPADGGEPTRVTRVADDLRDVVLVDGTLVLTRFRAAELLYLDDDRKIERREGLGSTRDGFEANVAWRAIVTPNGVIAVVHQRAFSGFISVNDDTSFTGSAGASDRGAAGEAGGPGIGAAGSESFPFHDGYGSGGPCSSVVETTVTLANVNGTLQPGPTLDLSVLPVDIAVSPLGKLAVANAGLGLNGSSVGIYTMSSVFSPDLRPGLNCFESENFYAGPGAIAVAFDEAGTRFVAQHREPAELVVFNADLEPQMTISLGKQSVVDTGHAIFHTDAGGGIACASCHPEGTDDGRVWRFSDSGKRRTQPLERRAGGHGAVSLGRRLAVVRLARRSSVRRAHVGSGREPRPRRGPRSLRLFVAAPARPPRRRRSRGAPRQGAFRVRKGRLRGVPRGLAPVER